MFRSEPSFTCPICLADKNIAKDNGEDHDVKSGDELQDTIVDQDGNPVFELTSCNHQFCTSCLRAYIRSKLMDGEPDVPCCYFHTAMAACYDGDDFEPCNVLICESDMNTLLHMDDKSGVQSNTNDNDWCCKQDERSSLFSSSNNIGEKVNSSEEGNKLWEKYQKLKFDKHHGKDAVRRCPQCDCAQLFDEVCMKRHKAKLDFLTDDTSPATSEENNRSNLRRLRDSMSGFRQRLGRAEDRPNSSDPDENKTNSSTLDQGKIVDDSPCMQKEETKEDTKQKDDDEGPLPLINKQEDAISKGEDEKGGSTVTDENKTDSNTLDQGEIVDVSPCMQKEERKENTKQKEDDESSPPSINKQEDAISKGEDGDGGSGRTTSQQPSDLKIESQSLVKSNTPIVTCQSCSTEFCYFHSNAHPGSSCASYNLKTAEMDKTNTEFAHRILRAKPCPNCGISVSKDGGCNQIKCGSCGTHFCWLCSKVVDDGAFPEHFRWWNIRGCANMQLDENNEPLTCVIWGAKILSALQILVLGIPAMILSLLSAILCPCFIAGCGQTNRERVINSVSFWGSFLSSMLLLPFTCLGMLILSAMYCLLASVALFYKLVTSLPRRSQRDTSNSSSRVPGEANDTNGEAAVSELKDATPNAASPEDFIRELENIFLERMEEGQQS